MRKWTSGTLSLVTALFTFTTAASAGMNFIQVAAKTKEDRSAVANAGVSIEAVRSDSIWGFANENAIGKLRAAKIPVLGVFDMDVARGGHENLFGAKPFGFPSEDQRFHTYEQTRAALMDLQSKNADIAKVSSIGKTVEGRDILAIHINTSGDALRAGSSNKPGVIFMGNHHAREHVSLEIPLMLAQYLLEHRADAKISSMLDSRDIWIVPMVNPDGAEFDIATGKYKWWRKNRRNNGDGTYGVDLNRNYGYKWGTGGSDTDTSSDIYMGTQPFSEPETQAIKAFVEAHLNAKILLTFHTFSELILYPWGSTYDAIANEKDHQVFETMAKTMAGWNGYKPEQSSGLYIASGDTTDWAYGEHGIFAFTFELSPSDMMDGGFYPGAKIIDRVFAANLKPALYMIGLADDPYRAVQASPSGFLTNYVEPRLPEELMF